MKKMLSYSVGAVFAALVVLGVFLLMAPKAAAVTVAVVIICLSVAYGILTADPGSLLPLVAGICMWVFPGWVVGIVFVMLGTAGTIVNLAVHKRKPI